MSYCCHFFEQHEILFIAVVDPLPGAAYKRASFSSPMTVIERTDPAPLSVDQNQTEDPSALLAEHILMRAQQDPAYLRQVPAHIRAHHDWFRSAVMLPLLRSIPASAEDGGVGVRTIIVMNAPEFLTDEEVRRAARMGPLQTERDRGGMETIARSQQGYLSGNTVEGAPITDQNPAHVQSHLLMNGSARFGQCDVCGSKGPLTFEAMLVIEQVRSLQMQTCADCEEVLAGGGSELTRNIYAHGRPA